MGKKESEGIAIKAVQADLLTELGGLDLTQVRSRADFGKLYDMLARAALKVARQPDGKQTMDGIECARRCLDSWAKAYAAFIDEDQFTKLQEDVQAHKQALLESFESLVGTTITADHAARLRERFSEGDEDA